MFIFELYYSSEVARHIRSDSYALIFGVNTFVAILLQTVISMIVVDKSSVLALNNKDQVILFK